MRIFGCAILCALLASACGGGDDSAAGSSTVHVTPAPPGEPWKTLDEWHLFADGPAQKPAERVEPYEVISPLWSDATTKRRFVFVPEGSTIGYEADALWRFPVGTILVKTFSYLSDAREPESTERLLETRLLVHEPKGWVAETYVWDEAQRHATRTLAGADLPVKFADAKGTQHEIVYAVPNTNMCGECHGLGDKLDTLGGRTRQLERDHDYGGSTENQIDHFAARGWLDFAPPAAERDRLTNPHGGAPVAERARSYLDANCAHCHRDGGGAASSGLWLDWKNTQAGTPVSFGICKTPTSAGGGTCGLVWDIVPGEPAASVLICRVASREPQVQMPPLATKLVDDDGLGVLDEWIAGLTYPACK